MPSIGRFIAASSDDAHEKRSGLSYDDSGTLVSIWRSARGSALEFTAGLRFINVAIPQAATILSATLFLGPNNVINDDLFATVHCHDVDNSATFSSGDTPFDREGVVTIAGTVVAQDGTFALRNADGYFEVDVLAPLQEVIDRGGFAENNAVSFIIIPGVGDTKRMDVRSFDGLAPTPKLEATFVGAEGPNVAFTGAVF